MNITKEEAIKHLKELKARCERLSVSSGTYPEKWRKDADAVGMAIDAMRSADPLRNGLLTLDELRNIRNVPVWLVWGYEMSEWALIRPYDDTRMEALVFDGEGDLFRIDEYGEEWKVYRRPPEGDDENE